ncbi:hypothetical protein E4T56_gene9761 [Termitomyces sp. T112]|nr:hypothetical protein E4T56_gene9761 [Termitomyces sp. T112]
MHFSIVWEPSQLVGGPAIVVPYSTAASGTSRQLSNWGNHPGTVPLSKQRFSDLKLCDDSQITSPAPSELKFCDQITMESFGRLSLASQRRLELSLTPIRTTMTWYRMTNVSQILDLSSTLPLIQFPSGLSVLIFCLHLRTLPVANLTRFRGQTSEIVDVGLRSLNPNPPL